MTAGSLAEVDTEETNVVCSVASEYMGETERNSEPVGVIVMVVLGICANEVVEYGGVSDKDSRRVAPAKIADTPATMRIMLTVRYLKRAFED